MRTFAQKQKPTQQARSSSPTNAVSRVGHDLIRIPVYSGTRSSIQLKLKVNAPGNAHEQEADRLADQVMRIPEPVTS